MDIIGGSGLERANQTPNHSTRNKSHLTRLSKLSNPITMAPPFDTNAMERQITEAFVGLGFKLTDARQRDFYELCFQYCKLEGRRIMEEMKRNPFRDFRPSEIVKYSAISFIKRYGEQLWPSDKSRCHHLSDIGFLEWRHRGCVSPEEHNQYQYEEKLSRVEWYFELLDRVPIVLHPDIGVPSLEAVDTLVQRVVDASDEPRPSVRITPTTSSFPSFLSVATTPTVANRPPTAPPLELVRRFQPQLELNMVPTRPPNMASPSTWTANNWQAGSQLATSSRQLPTSPTYMPSFPPISPISTQYRYQPTCPTNFSASYKATSPFVTQAPWQPPVPPSTSSTRAHTPSQTDALAVSLRSPQKSFGVFSPTSPHPNPPRPPVFPSSSQQSPTSPLFNQGQLGRPNTSSSSNAHLPDPNPTFGSEGRSK